MSDKQRTNPAPFLEKFPLSLARDGMEWMVWVIFLAKLIGDWVTMFCSLLLCYGSSSLLLYHVKFPHLFASFVRAGK